MGVALAFKRVGRAYRIPLRRFLREAVIYLLGFLAGMFSIYRVPNADIAVGFEWIMGITLAFLLVLAGIKLVRDAPLPDRK